MRSVALLVLLGLCPPRAVAQDAPEREPAPLAAEDPAEEEAALRDAAGALALRRGDLAGARADFARAFELAPTAARGWALADVFGALGDAAAQARALRALLGIADDHPRAAEWRARLAVLDARAEAPVEAAPAGDPPPASSEPPPAEPSRDVLDEPWLWAIVAVVAIAGIAVALALTSGPGLEEPIAGDAGDVAYTLVAWP
ncbi:MAG: hypothetical protein KF729_32395 [Sandaracinaceae bacterium]|nr:hypothetical protein [Sandaracinaceae bacterium]